MTVQQRYNKALSEPPEWSFIWFPRHRGNARMFKPYHLDAWFSHKIVREVPYYSGEGYFIGDDFCEYEHFRGRSIRSAFWLPFPIPVPRTSFCSQLHIRAFPSSHLSPVIYSNGYTGPAIHSTLYNDLSEQDEAALRGIIDSVGENPPFVYDNPQAMLQWSLSKAERAAEEWWGILDSLQFTDYKKFEREKAARAEYQRALRAERAVRGTSGEMQMLAAAGMLKELQ